MLNAGRRYLGVEDLAGKVFVTSGLGGMSGAQAKAAVIVGCVGIIAEVRPAPPYCYLIFLLLCVTSQIPPLCWGMSCFLFLVGLPLPNPTLAASSPAHLLGHLSSSLFYEVYKTYSLLELINNIFSTELYIFVIAYYNLSFLSPSTVVWLLPVHCIRPQTIDHVFLCL